MRRMGQLCVYEHGWSMYNKCISPHVRLCCVKSNAWCTCWRRAVLVRCKVIRHALSAETLWALKKRGALQDALFVTTAADLAICTVQCVAVSTSPPRGTCTVPSVPDGLPAYLPDSGWRSTKRPCRALQGLAGSCRALLGLAGPCRTLSTHALLVALCRLGRTRYSPIDDARFRHLSVNPHDVNVHTE